MFGVITKVFLAFIFSLDVSSIKGNASLSIFESFNSEDTNWILSFLVKEALPVVSGISDSQCKNHLLKVYYGLIEQQQWAIEMLDSWAKPQTGLLTGNIMHIGNYDECLDIDANNIRGQYCSVVLRPSKTKKFNTTNVLLSIIQDEIKQQFGDLADIKTSFGICIPKSCTPKVLQNIADTLDEYFELGVQLYFEEFLCDYKGKLEFSRSAITTSAIFAIIITAVVVATVYDIVTLQRKDRIRSLIALSAYTNSKKIWSNHTNDENIPCLNGIKSISIFWIILGHKYMILPYVPYINASTLKKWIENPLNMTVIAASFAVDTFFVISGLLVSYTYFKTESKKIRFNPIRYLLHRLIRLTPSLASLVLFLAMLMPYIGDGPLWDLVLKYSQSDCKRNWWAILLYVQNYVYPYTNCAPHAWYLSVDTQLYILAPILLIPFAKWPKNTIAVVLLITFGSISWSFANSWTKDLDLMYYNDSMDFHSFYISTHFRASSWLIGLMMGYIMFKIKGKKVVLRRILILSLWFISLLTMFAVIFGHFSFIANEHNKLKASLFNAFSRPSWCLAICWIIFACSNGCGGVINKFLSLGVFTVCARISYAIYLLHVLQILYTIGTGRLVKYFSNQEELRVIWADFVTTMFIAFIWTLLFELPAIGLEKVLLERIKRKNRSNNSEMEIESGTAKLSSE